MNNKNKTIITGIIIDIMNDALSFLFSFLVIAIVSYLFLLVGKYANDIEKIIRTHQQETAIMFAILFVILSVLIKASEYYHKHKYNYEWKQIIVERKKKK